MPLSSTSLFIILPILSSEPILLVETTPFNKFIERIHRVKINGTILRDTTFAEVRERVRSVN